MPFALAAALSLAISLVAWRLRALTGAGAVAAIAVGTSISAFAGWPGLVVLGLFFGSSTMIGRLVEPRGGGASDAKGETRDQWQVLSNGGVAALVAPVELVAPGLGWWMACVSLAAAQADTWATGFGTLSRRPPRDIVRWDRVAPGTSGGVTWMGTSGGLMGAALVGMLGATTSPIRPLALYGAATLIGFGGMLLDSVLGAVAQGRFHCPACDRPSERRIHRCGEPTELRTGWPWLDNDGVNAVSTGIAAAAALCWWWVS